MHGVYIRAAFKDLRAVAKSLVPALELEIELVLSKSTGEIVQLPDAAQAIFFDVVQGFLYWNSPGDTDWLRAYIGTGFPGPAFHQQGLTDNNPTQDCSVVFPLGDALVSKLEDLRSGRDASLRAYFKVTGHATVALNQFNPPEAFREQAAVNEQAAVSATSFLQSLQREAGAVPFHINRLALTDRYGNQQEFSVAKSRWAEEILPRLGWGVSKIIELPFAGLEDSLKETDKLVDEAEKKFYIGDWTGSLTASRRAVETLQPVVKEHINPAHTDKDQGKSAEAKADDLAERFENLAQSVLNYQGAVRRVLAAGAHKPVPGATLERPDAELGLLLALGLRRYVGLRMQTKLR